MNEFEISNAFRENEIKIEQCKMLFSENAENKNSQLGELINLKNRLSGQLIRSEDKNYSFTAISSIKKQYGEYLNCLEKFDLNSFINRNASSHKNDFLFIMISEDIYHLIADKHNLWIHRPANISVTSQMEKGIKNRVLIDFFKNELLILDAVKTINYLIVYEYYCQFKIRLEKVFL